MNVYILDTDTKNWKWGIAIYKVEVLTEDKFGIVGRIIKILYTDPGEVERDVERYKPLQGFKLDQIYKINELDELKKDAIKHKFTVSRILSGA